MKSIQLNKSAVQNEQLSEKIKGLMSTGTVLSRDALKKIKGGGGEDDNGEEDAIIYL